MAAPDRYSSFGGDRPSVIQTVPTGLLPVLLHHAREQRFRAGQVLVREGEEPPGLYVIRSGIAEVLVEDQAGDLRQVLRVEAGHTIGEMSLFRGGRSSGTVRAVTDLHVWMLAAEDFEAAAEQHPNLYRTLGATIADRLDALSRRHVAETPTRVAVLRDTGAPPLLAYALACSLAWHVRRPTLLLTGDPSIRDLAWAARDPGPGQTPAEVRIVQPDLSDRALRLMVDESRGRYADVLVHLPAARGPLFEVRPDCQVWLASSHAEPVRGEGLTIAAWSRDGLPWRPVDGVVSVPALRPADELGLRLGVLGAATPAGKALGRAAREVAGLRVGLALGAGGAKGYAHLGVLRVLDRLGIPIDCIAGSSIGGAVAALRAFSYSVDEAAAVLDQAGDNTIKPAVPWAAMLSSDKLRATLRSFAGERRIEDATIPLALVATDIELGREVVFTRGLAWPAVLASMAIPGIYPAQRMGSRILVDGGVVNPVPGSAAVALGADVVIAVRLTSSTALEATDATAVVPAGRGPSMVQTLMRSVDLMQQEVSRAAAGDAAVQIEPVCDTSGTGLRDFRRGRRHVGAGVEAAEAALPQLASALPWLRDVV
jgi:NTE family protein